MVLGCVNRTACMGYQAVPHGSLGLPGGLYQFMALTEGTPLPFGSEWVLGSMFISCIKFLLHSSGDMS